MRRHDEKADMMPPIIDAVQSDVTLDEICDTLHERLGEHRDGAAGAICKARIVRIKYDFFTSSSSQERLLHPFFIQQEILVGP